MAEGMYMKNRSHLKTTEEWSEVRPATLEIQPGNRGSKDYALVPYQICVCLKLSRTVYFDPRLAQQTTILTNNANNTYNSIPPK
jgi:hypothetical protein